MRFDDRLRTVLNHPGQSRHDRAVRWRQLVDLLARAGTLEGSAHAQEALDLIRCEAPEIDGQLRAAAARAVAALPLPFELVELFARDSISVAAPIIAAAHLSSDQWSSILQCADEETAQFIRALHPEAIGQRAAAEPAKIPSAGADKPRGATPSIQEVIHRIEAIRETRHKPPVADPPAAEIEDVPVPRHDPVGEACKDAEPEGLFRWECGPSGELDWVEGAPRAALIGRGLIDPAHVRDGGSGEVARAFALRAPFSNAVVALAEETVLAGEWELSGVPAFDHLSGRFAGYRGIARRIRQRRAAGEARAAPHPDTLRELVHEIKTPLNAIMGFAQIIEAQMFGPAGASYRERAAEIVAQSHLLLAAIEDLDLAAKLQAGTAEHGVVTDLAVVLEAVVPTFDEHAQAAGVELGMTVEHNLPPCPVGAAVVERLLRRLVNGLIDCSESGQRLELTARLGSEGCIVAIGRPPAIDGIPDEHLLDPGFTAPRQRNARLSLGFSLRLVRGIAQLAGGDLKIGKRELTLVLGQAGLRPPASDRYRRSAG